MKYGSMKGGARGPGYSTGKSMSHTTLSGKQAVKVGRSEGLKVSHLSDGAHPGVSNKSGVRSTAAVDMKNRKGQ